MRLLSVCAFLIASCSSAEPDQAEIERLLEAMTAYVEDARAKAPQGEDTTSTLVRIGAVDQAVRRWLIDESGLMSPEFRPEGETDPRPRLFGEMHSYDLKNQKKLKRLLKDEDVEWFRASVYGDEAAHAAWLVLQHADIDFQAELLPVIERYVAQGDARGSNYALLYDRVTVREGGLQRYGSQFKCEDGVHVPVNGIEDPENLDARRKAFGLGPWEDYRARFSDPC